MVVYVGGICLFYRVNKIILYYTYNLYVYKHALEYIIIIYIYTNNIHYIPNDFVYENIIKPNTYL